MRTFSSLLVLATLAVAGTAVNLPASFGHIATSAGCNGATIEHSSSIKVGGRVIQRFEIGCEQDKAAVRRTTTSPTHVCGLDCTTSCNNDAGGLPPISEDCDVLVDAINIFQGEGPSSNVVHAGRMDFLSFGTCMYWFANNSDEDLEYCWDDMAGLSPKAGGACFPPHQPFTSEGLCTSADGLWAFGAAHS